jgi:SHS2 domain-containing protein
VEKLIKAVTYHDLSIRETAEGYETIVVFDV